MTLQCLLQMLLVPLSWFRALFFAVNTVVVCALHSLILIPLYPIRFILPQLYITIESFLYSKCGQAFVPVFSVFPQLKVYTDTLSEIDDVTRRRAIVMSNHQDSGDVPVMMCLVAYFNISHTTTWISDRMFKWTQFGIPSQWHKCFFSQEGNKDQVLKQLRQHVATTYFERGHKWLVFFPEGGYLKNRGERARKWAEKNNLPQLYNCCLPRAAAFVNIVQAFRGEEVPVPDTVDDIVDITMAFKGSRDLCLSDFIFGTFSESEVYLNFRTYKMSDLPTDEKELEHWLYDRYVEKEELLKNFKEKGEFVEGSSFTQIPPRSGILLGALAFWYISAFFVFDFYKSMLGYIIAGASRLT